MYDMPQQFGAQNPTQWGAAIPQNISQLYGQQGQRVPGQGFNTDGLAATGGVGFAQAAFGPQGYGSPFGQLGMGGFGQGGYGQQPNWGMQSGYGQQRQLTPLDVAEVARQLAPLVAQAQQQPLAAFGYGPSGQQQRLLSQQDVADVVRQILPILPQIVGALQQQGGGAGQPGAMSGQIGFGQGFMGHHQHTQNPFGQAFGNPQQFGQMGQPFGQMGQPSGQMGWPGAQAAYGAPQNWASTQPQRQLTPQDITEVARHLASMLPQANGAGQSFGQQRAF
jgi:hypothetical protein